ncbi:hypothetical protein [Psychroserpens luteus]|uniref:Collagen triple helix repeat-containing protein n=1 Tax=Psychroserpens luteus TaxID=1434066 RepID=A0ABW5ZRC1_9FLAO|nr:hypothetical protein [Psychroserpens luteus]
MKKLKATMRTTTYFIIALLIAFTYSCEAEDGTDGIDGINGSQGEQGEAGQDGNANVQTFTFDVSAINSTNFSINFPELTQDVIENDAILTYIARESTYFTIPGISFNDMMEVELQPSDLDIFFYDRITGSTTTPVVGLYDLVKVIIIESSNTNRMNEPNDIYSQLENANVDINNYHEVCNYFGIKY